MPLGILLKKNYKNHLNGNKAMNLLDFLALKNICGTAHSGMNPLFATSNQHL
jgi:hypothetical protein